MNRVWMTGMVGLCAIVQISWCAALVAGVIWLIDG